MSDRSNRGSVEKERTDLAEKSKIPLLPIERTLGFWDHCGVATAGSIATWLFLTGCWIGMAMPVPLGIINIIFATILGIIPIAFMGRYFSRWGGEHSTGFAPMFGTLGIKILMVAAFLPIYWLWTSIPPVMFGRAIATTGEIFGAQPSLLTNPMLWGFVMLGIGWWVTYRGRSAITWLARISVPIMLILIILISVRMFTFYGWDNIVTHVPAGLAAEPFLSFMIAFEISVAVGISWVGNAAEYTRLTKSEPTAFWGIIIGWGLAWGIFCIPGLLAGNIAGVTDPIEALVIIGGNWTVIYLIMLAFANATSVVMEIYMVGLMLMGIFPRLRWLHATLICLPVVIFFILVPWAYDAYGSFVTVTAAILGPISGVFLVHAFMARFNLNLKEAINPAKEGAYHFAKGINPWGFIAVAIGTGVALSIYNPFTCAVHIPSIFNAIGMTIPSILAGGLAYYILARIFLIPKRIGFPEMPLPTQVSRDS